MSDRLEDLERLGRLRDEGKISEAEYQNLKQDLLRDGSVSAALPAAGWYPDPTGVANRQAYWDGEQWTGHTHDDAPGLATPPTLNPKPKRSGCLRVVIVAVVLVGLIGVVALVAVQLAGSEISETFSEVSSVLDSASSSGSCSALTASQIATLTDGWTGNGNLTVVSTGKASTSGSEMFSQIWYLEGSAPGIENTVFAFATDPGGLVVGADSVTREFSSWGAAASSDSPAAQQARMALNAAHDCLR
ncbi:MAG: DUF2510 domain-containing protein [Acidimicrobiia bacterium]